MVRVVLYSRKNNIEKLYKKTQSNLAEAQALATQKRNEIIRTYAQSGDDHKDALDRFFSACTVQSIDTPDDPDLETFYAIYKDVFPIKEEQESLEGFQTELATNFDLSLQEKYGPMNETILLLRAPAHPDGKNPKGEIIGAIDYCTYNLERALEAQHNTHGGQFLIYLFIAKEYRGLGATGLLQRRAAAHSKRFIAQTSRTGLLEEDVKMLVLNEQNQPRKMSLFNYFYDSMNACIDQCDRLKYWADKGFRKLKLDYVQPALGEGGQASHELALYAQTDKPVHSAVLSALLYRYFLTAILKNQKAELNEDWRQLEKAIKQKDIIEIEKGEDFKALKKSVWLVMRRHFSSLFKQIKQRPIIEYMREEAFPRKAVKHPKPFVYSRFRASSTSMIGMPSRMGKASEALSLTSSWR